MLTEKISQGVVTVEELIDSISNLPALLWRVDIIKNKIEYLNRYVIPGLGENPGLLLQNIDFSEKVILQEDFSFFEEFIKSMREGRTAATVFRVHGEDNSVRWIKLIGTSDRYNPQHFIGFMLDVSETAGIVRQIIEQESEMEAMIEFVSNPVLLVEPLDWSIVAFNKAAQDLFDIRTDKIGKTSLTDLYPSSFRQQVERIREDILFQKKWEGRLFFQRRNKSLFMGNVSIRVLFLKGRQLIRLSVYEIETNTGLIEELAASKRRDLVTRDPEKERFSKYLLKKIAKKNNMVEILGTFLENQEKIARIDGIIYSDVHAKKNQVYIETVGAPFATLDEGHIFPFEGTIAENIERFKLDYLIVEDTFESIKAIDWALFIPHGIRSYFAKPFYERSVIRSVLILCSTERKGFSPEYIENYAILYESFLRGLKNCRKSNRARRKNGSS